MSKAKDTENRVAVKMMLAKKWEHLAKVANSIPAQQSFTRRAAKYRRQAADLSRT